MGAVHVAVAGLVEFAACVRHAGHFEHTGVRGEDAVVSAEGVGLQVAGPRGCPRRFLSP